MAVIENDDEMEQFIAVGNIPTAKSGMTFLFRGEWKTHPSYGEQFSFFDCTEEVPENEAGIREFLASGVIRGIGPKMAEAIVKKFGKDTLNIIEKEPQRLTEVDGIGEAKAKGIIEGYRAHREFAEVSLFFAGYGIKDVYKRQRQESSHRFLGCVVWSLQNDRACRRRNRCRAFRYQSV